MCIRDSGWWARPIVSFDDANGDGIIGVNEVVVGSWGLGGFTGLVVDSIAIALTHHAPCPLNVVRP